jgi:hypothetical protein
MGWNFEDDLVTRFLCPCVELEEGSACAERGGQSNAASLKNLASHAGRLATKNVTLPMDREFHLKQVV